MDYRNMILGVEEFLKDYENVVAPEYAVSFDDLMEQVAELSIENRNSNFNLIIEQERTKDGDARTFLFLASSDEDTDNHSVTYLGCEKSA